MNRIACLFLGVALLLTPSSCTRNGDVADKGGIPPLRHPPKPAPAPAPAPETTQADGEPLPPPVDVQVAQSKTGPNRSSNPKGSTKPERGAPGSDQTLVLLATVVQHQEKQAQRMEAIDKRLGDFLPAVDAQNKQIEQLKDHQVPNLAATTQQLEKRVAAVEEIVRRLEPGTITELPRPAKEVVEAKDSKDVKDANDVKETKDTKEAAQTVEILPTPSEPRPARETALLRALDPDQAIKEVATKPVKFTPYVKELRDKVREAYYKVISDYPESPAAVDAAMGLGAMAEEEGVWNTAMSAYTFVSTNFPDSPSASDAKFNLARALQGKGEYAQAHDAYARFSNEYPKHPLCVPAQLAAADCLMLDGSNDMALKEYRAVERANFDTGFSQIAREKMGELQMKEKRYAEAIDTFKLASQNAVGDVKTQLDIKLAQAYVGAREFRKAQNTLARVLALKNGDDTRSAARLLLARSYEEEENSLSAARAYAQAAAECPKAEFANDARLHAAECYLSAELPDHALEQLTALLKTGANESIGNREKFHPAALFASARALRQMGKLDEAKQRLAELRQKYPDHDLVFDSDLEEANVLAQGGKVTEAIALLRQLLRQHPNSKRAANTMLQIAELQDQSGDKRRGVALYAELLEKAANTDQVYSLKLRRGLLMLDIGRTAEAFTLLSALTEDTSASAVVRAVAQYSCALIDQRAGRLKEAIVAYEKAVETGTGDGKGAADLAGLVDDAKWKISKLKWLAQLQGKNELSIQKDIPAAKSL